jgi:hypothetical protein
MAAPAAMIPILNNQVLFNLFIFFSTSESVEVVWEVYELACRPGISQAAVTFHLVDDIVTGCCAAATGISYIVQA